MKKRPLSLALALVFILLLTACGGSGGTTSSEYRGVASEDMVMPEGESGGVSPATPTNLTAENGTANISQDKIIYSADAGVETKDYDASLAGVYAMVETYGGFLESSSIGGTSYSSTRGRVAEFVLRVPSDKFSELTGALSGLGNVTYCNSASQNVTTEYIDVQSRLESYRIQEERLLAMLEKAELLEDMLTIERHLADVRYNIESYTTSLNYLESQVSYSTVSIRITEVVDYTPDVSVTQSFFSRMSTAFTGGMSGLVSFVQGVILFLLYYWYILAIIAGIVVLVVRRLRKSRRERFPFDPKPKDDK